MVTLGKFFYNHLDFDCSTPPLPSLFAAAYALAFLKGVGVGTAKGIGMGAWRWGGGRVAEGVGAAKRVAWGEARAW